MTSWTHMVYPSLLVHLSLLACFGSKLLTLATQCDDICTYTQGPSISDANCHGVGLARIPPGCEDATTLHLGDNNIIINHDTFRDFNHLKILYLGHNNIDSLVAGVFQPIATTIKSLDLSFNTIQRLENDTFVNMTQLEQLNLMRNGIIFIAEGAFRNLPSLELLFLRDNLIEYLPLFVFDEMPRLQQLHLQSNKILKFHSRTLQNLNSLAHLLLSDNNITSLIGGPLHAELQLQKINFSLNNIEQFNCNWTNELSTLISIDLSQNHIQSIPNCKSHLGILKLTANPFDCSCSSTIQAIASWFHMNPNLTSPICGYPPGKQGQKLRDISFDECYTSRSPTVRVTSRLPTTQTIHQTTLTGRKEYTTTEKTSVGFPTLKKVKNEYASSNKDKLFTNKNILYFIIIGFAVLTVLVVMLIFLILVKHCQHSRKHINPSHYMTTITSSSLPNMPPLPNAPSLPNTPTPLIIPSLPNTPYQQTGTSTGTRSSHLYATIGDRRNTGDFTPTSSTRQVELVTESVSSGHSLPHERRQSDTTYRSPSHRPRNTRQDPGIYQSDSQDSGLADQGFSRDSVTEWLMLHGGIHYLQIPDEETDEMSASGQPDETAPLTGHPAPPPKIPQSENHRIKPEMVTLLNSSCPQRGNCRNSHCLNCREDPTVSQLTTFRLQSPTKARPSSGTYVPHQTVH